MDTFTSSPPVARSLVPIAHPITIQEHHPANETHIDLVEPSLISEDLTGVTGRNRNQEFCLIPAKNDSEAIRDYLHRFRNSQKTCRSYEKELSRFLLWCVSYRRVAMSSVLTDDCEAYKDFIANPDPSWIGPKANRNSAQWRPFHGPLSPQSQRYAIQVLRNFFSWLVDTRYLGGNPWITVDDPKVEENEIPMDIDKALPARLWDRLAKVGGLLDRVCETASTSAPRPPLAKTPHPTNEKQFRLARAIILLMGHTGTRREEVATAQRSNLKPVPNTRGSLWELKVLGKRKKWRTVYLPSRVVDAIRAHWEDRGLNFDKSAAIPLFAPVVIPPTETAKRKHSNSSGGRKRADHQPFTPEGLYMVVKSALLRIASDTTLRLTKRDREILRTSAPHAFRHTFATQAVAKGMPTDVLQLLMGHASSTTTSIYVRAERGRAINEVKALHSRPKTSRT